VTDGKRGPAAHRPRNQPGGGSGSARLGGMRHGRRLASEYGLRPAVGETLKSVCQVREVKRLWGKIACRSLSLRARSPRSTRRPTGSSDNGPGPGGDSIHCQNAAGSGSRTCAITTLRSSSLSGLNSRSPYPGDRNYSCPREGFFWHTKRMFSARTGVAIRARIALEVFLRLTRMDVCCGPPAYR